ncbi:MAG: type II secretory pathway component PulF [Candidatus Krumholzibacteriia bacterium]|jgi:type II secretory pathway component PulF
MNEYRYNAITVNGQTVTGVRQAVDAEELARELMSQGLVVLGTSRTFGALGKMFSPGHRKARKELKEFTQHMATCLAAGVTAVSAISEFQSTTTGFFNEVLGDIKGDVSSGTQLDEAFSRHPELFGPVFLALVSAGQNSGGLDAAFEELVAYLEWSEDLKGQTTQALIYPAMLLTGILGLFLLMMLYVMPRFAEIFNDSNFELPALTVYVMSGGEFMVTWWWAIFGSIGGAIIGAKMYFATEAGALRRDGWLLKMPVVGAFQRKLALSRFAKTFALIIASGVDLMKVLELMSGVVGNQVMAKEIDTVRQRVASGQSLTEAFEDANLFPPLVMRLVAVGERTGSLDVSLRKVSDHLDKEIPRDLKKAFTIFEGVVIAVLGVLVCVAALALLMPIMSVGVEI